MRAEYPNQLDYSDSAGGLLPKKLSLTHRNSTASTRQDFDLSGSAQEVQARRRKKLVTLLDLCVSSLRRGHTNLLCIVPILSDDRRSESKKLSNKKHVTLLDLCVSSLRRGHANLLCIVPILSADRRSESKKRSRKKLVALLDLCVSSLRRSHANLLCIVPILSDNRIQAQHRHHSKSS